MRKGISTVLTLCIIIVPIMVPLIVVSVKNEIPNSDLFVTSIVLDVSKSLGFILTEDDYIELLEFEEEQTIVQIHDISDYSQLPNTVSRDIDWVDVMFLYDDDARDLFNSHYPLGMDPIEVCEDIVYGINLVYNQYSKTDDLEFYFQPNFCIYDADGPRGYSPWDLPYATSSMDVAYFMHYWALQKHWPYNSGATWQSYGRIAPSGIGVHGGRWDLLIMLSGENLLHKGSPDFIAATWRCDNRLLLKVPKIARWGPSGQGDDGFTIGVPGFWCAPGAWSAAAHEIGHDYGIYGDTYGTRLDLMDYFWAMSKPWSHSLDNGHQNDVYPWTYIHSY